jgi:hypothetical protein
VLNYPMCSNLWRQSATGLRNNIFTFALCALLAACAASPVQLRALRFDDPGALPVLAYYQMLSRMTPAELGRERMVLNALPKNANTQLRMAVLLGYPRSQQELGKSLNLLDNLLKSNDPDAISLHPLTRMLADNYVERQKLEGQVERQAQQLKESQRKVIELQESQRKVVELQEKLDGLADIERTLPSPSSRRSGAGGAQ